MLELRGITAGYGASVVLRGVSLSVPPSSVVALLGPNGAGKTTLLRVASGLLAPTTGDVLLDDVRQPHGAPHQLAAAGVCHVPEGRGVFPSLSVRDNLLLFAAKGSAAAVDLAVDAFPRLGERLGQAAGTMSGGEQQMLALARAYVQEPRFVLLDEVSMGLAPVVIDEIYAFLARLAYGGTALLLVEQYAERALAIADYVYVLTRGQVVFAGEPTELDEQALVGHYLARGEARPAGECATSRSS